MAEAPKVTRNQQYAPAPTVERGKSAHIGGDPKNKSKIVYTSGQLVLVRNVQNPVDVFIYQEHKHPTLCARMTPSGFYVASADASNKILIWDTVGEDHVIKLEKQTVGKITDMAWTDDSKRLIVVGQGSAKHGEAFMIDGGASVGEIGQHMKPILSADVKQSRPYRVVTGSEDMQSNFYEGPPFKYKLSNKQHTRGFVTCVRYAPNGETYVTVGTDKSIHFYDGKDGSLKKSIPDAHNGGIYGVSWASDSKRIVTSSADKTCKIWDSETGQVLHTVTFGSAMEDQQLGCLWQGNDILSINLNGDISYLNENSDKPVRVLSGHSKPIEAFAYCRGNDTFYTADRDGRILGTNRTTGFTTQFTGAQHKSKVISLAITNNVLYSVSMDNTLKITSTDNHTYTDGIPLGSQPVGVAAAANLVFVATKDTVLTLRGRDIVSTLKAPWGPASIASSPNGDLVAVGSTDNKTRVYTVAGTGALTESYVLANTSAVVSVAFSPNGARLATGDVGKEVHVYEKTTKISKAIGMAGRIDVLRFTPDNSYIVAGGLDSSFVIHAVEGPKIFEQRNAHIGGVKGIEFVDANNLLTTGGDLVTRSWNVRL